MMMMMMSGVLLIFYPIYLLIYFQYLKVRKPIFLLNHSALVSKSLVCCIKSSRLWPNFYHSLSIFSLSCLALNLTAKCTVFFFPCPFLPLLYRGWVVAYVVDYVHEIRTPNIRRIFPQDPLHWLSKENLLILTLSPVVWVLKRMKKDLKMNYYN